MRKTGLGSTRLLIAGWLVCVVPRVLVKQVSELAARPNRWPALTSRGQWKGVLVLRLEMWTRWDRPTGLGWENVTRVMTAVSDC